MLVENTCTSTNLIEAKAFKVQHFYSNQVPAQNLESARRETDSSLPVEPDESQANYEHRKAAQIFYRN